MSGGRTILAAALMLLASSALASPAVADAPAYAIVIGHNDPPREGAGSELPPLRYADDDAARYYQLLDRFADTRLLAVLDEPTQRRYPGLARRAERPTLENLRRAVADIAASMQADRARGDRPVFYLAFSGHGARADSGEAFLALAGGALTEDILYDEVLAPLPSAYSHLLIDACHAGGVVGARGFFDTQIEGQSAPVERDRAAEVVARRIDEFPQVGFIVATTLGQEAHEWSEIESGVFTHALLSALLGPADVNGDSRIEYSEVQAFVASSTRGLPDPRAIPKVVAEPPRAYRNAPLVAIPRIAGERVLSGDLGALGRFYIELEDGQRYLDAHLVRGEKAVIALPADARAFVRTASREAELPARGPARAAALKFRERAVASRGSLDASYRAALFSSAYGTDYYRGFVDSTGAIGVRFDDPRARRDSPSGRPTRRKHMAVGAASVSGASAITTAVGGAVAVWAKREFERTELQRPAYEAKRRFERSLLVTGVAGGTAIASGVLAWWLWPDSELTITPASSAGGDHTISLGLSF